MRILVVGAGLSGLTCALRLREAGVDVQVLEARSRVGGRAWRVDLGDGNAYQAGCELVDDAHESLLRLAADAGVAARRREPGRFRWRFDGVTSFEEPPLAGSELDLFQELGAEIERIRDVVDPSRPGELEGADVLDSQTLGGWLRGRGASAAVLAVTEAWYANSASVPIDEISLLAFAAKRAAGAEPTGLELRFEGGPGTLAARLGDLLGDRIALEAQVAAVEEESGGVVVRRSDGSTERADRAVLALPLTMLSEVEIGPPLPEHRRLAGDRARYGAVVKALVRPRGPVPPGSVLTEEAFVYPAEESDAGLVVYVAATPAKRLGTLPRDEQGAALARIASEAFELPRGSVEPRHHVVWADERYTRGSYLIFGPGDLLTWGRRLREPHGRIHFAGAETSTLPSYMEGAVRAGERAAGEVLAAG